MRLKKGWLILLTSSVCVYLFIRMEFFATSHYRPLSVLQDAESESYRLLKLFNAKNYMCNSSFIVGNRSMAFPLCTDNNSGIILDQSHHGVVYSIGLGPEDGFDLEHTLAANFSFPVFIITHFMLPSYFFIGNNTFFVPARIVPNDYADFSRNSYSQHTLNDIISMLKHKHIDIIKIWSVASGVEMWELIYYMIRDGLLSNVKQFHFHIHINTIEEDLLYNWYRTLYNLFYQARFALYHVSASSPLCLQVTLMESCSYYLSWIKDPGLSTFLMHPPAGLGSEKLEMERLLDFIQSKRVWCHKLYEVEQWTDNRLLVMTPVPPSWLVCIDDFYKHKCIVYSFSSSSHQRFLERAIKSDLLEDKSCDVRHFVPGYSTADPTSPTLTVSSLVSDDKKRLDVSTVVRELSLQSHVSVVEINLPSHLEWSLLQTLLDGGALVNASQVLMKITLTDSQYGLHPKVLRHEFSQLKQLEKQGFHVFYSSPCTDSISATKQKKEMSDCYQLGFTRTETIYNRH